MAARRQHLVIVGAGFAGLACARALQGGPYQVTVLDRRNHHLFQPLLYQVATGLLEPAAVATPLRSLLHARDGYDLRRVEVLGLDVPRRTLHSDAGDIRYDKLILACGVQTQFHGLTPTLGLVFDLKSLAGAMALHDHLFDCFERALVEPDADQRRALLSFVVVGGGATGTEFAGALADLINGNVLRDCPNLKRSALHIHLVYPDAALLHGFDDRLRQYSAADLTRRGVTLHPGVRVTGWGERSVQLSDASTLPAATVLWAAGITPAAWIHALDLPHDPSGRIQVGADFSVAGQPDIYVIGDLAATPTRLPQVAPAAIQSGQALARQLRRPASSKPFHYRDRGQMAVLGRFSAVVQLTRPASHWRGFSAWLAWLLLHLMSLVGFRNRLLALLDWSVDYLRRDTANRVSASERDGV
jgi:NADH dehydrogenase